MTSLHIILYFFFCASFCGALEKQSLSGSWIVDGGATGIIINNATVPGGIFTDLMQSGNIGDIFYEGGDLDYAWVGQSDWTYTRNFTVQDSLLSHNTVTLVFEGLDTFAAITINGKEVGSTENMFRRYVFDVKDLLQSGDNEISVQFTSPVNRAAALAAQSEYVIPPECHPDEYSGNCYVNQIRKMQASFAWDWGPTFPSMGIWKEVYLQAFDDSVINDIVISTFRDPVTGYLWILEAVVYFNAGAKETINGTVEMEVYLNNTVKRASVPVLLSKSVSENSEIKLTFPDMKFEENEVGVWWPNGYGSQTLYRTVITYMSNVYEEISEREVYVGFRSIELVQESLDNGSSFYFVVNDVPIFAKGANEIPISVLPELGQDPKTIEQVLQSAKDVHMNMLRVWGGGVYESDYFYDLADQYGIMIWQDFMFACALYPSTDTFLDNVAAEVRHQVKRLARHPSIVLWAGNNENEAALATDWYNTTANFDLYKEDYVKLYVDTVRSTLLDVLPQVTFVTSSPTNGQESDSEGYVATNPYDPFYGDLHFYDYESDSWDPSSYPITRFASEYGYQSMPSIEAWLTATNDTQNLKPSSSFLLNRQHHPDGNNQNVNLINLQMQLPDESNDNFVETFVYFSQILQAQSIKMETEHYRSYKGRVDNETGLGYTMGALYWQLNDVWVAPTWSGVDFTGRWKMLQYYAKDFFSPTIITGSRGQDDVVDVYIVTDDLQPRESVTAVTSVYRWDSFGAQLSVESSLDIFDSEKAILITSLHVDDAFNTAHCGDDADERKKNCFFVFELLSKENEHLAPTNYMFLEKLKNSNLVDANVTISSVKLSDVDKVFEIEVTTNGVALFVWLDAHNIKGKFSENGFLQFEASKTVTFSSDESLSVDDLEKVLTVTHLRDAKHL